uniref:Beta-porphyranase A C-terminal domain-containing protein n=1 Tax=Rhodosorus marinus TaxID=101924 RepID=A0A7S3EDX5_9RHOD|mmetsp:Transcript_28228/g.110874  ORF Transcript_28228/g.110874 Transcript_28228/m.110874 type:complete len:981 (+) Transcript_28228:120-3062(+)
MKPKTWAGALVGFLAALCVLSSGAIGAAVRIDFWATLVTNGKRDFSRERLVQAHGNSGSPENAREMMEYLMDDLGVQFGRSAGEGPFTASDNFPNRMDSAQEDGALFAKRTTCKLCDPLEKRFLSSDRVVVDKAEVIKKFHHPPSRVEAAARWVPKFLEYFFDEEGGYPPPKYIEPFNEPFTQARDFKLPNEKQDSVVARLGEITGRFCARVTSKDPFFMVGGPAAATARPYLSDFHSWRVRTKNFIDSALKAGCLSFFSEHVYNSGGAVQDANLDLLENYFYHANNSAPFKYMITESGGYDKSWYNKKHFTSANPLQSRDFFILSEAFKALMSTLRIHDSVLKIISFLILDPNDRRCNHLNRYPWALTEGGRDKPQEWTRLVKYFELLRGIEGDFVYSYSNNPRLTVHTVANRDKGYIMLQNLHTRNAETVDFKFPTGLAPVLKVVQRKIWLLRKQQTSEETKQNLLRGGDLRWTNRTMNTMPSSVLVFPRAMTVLELTFAKPLVNVRKVLRSRHMMDSIQDEAGNVVEFPVPIKAGKKINVFFTKIPKSRLGMVYVRIAHSRTLNRAPTPRVWINGVSVPVRNSEMAGPKPSYSSSYFGVIVVPYELTKLNSERRPQVTVQYPDSGGFLSTVTLQVERCTNGACCLLPGRSTPVRCTNRRPSLERWERPIPLTQQVIKDPSFEKNTVHFWKLSDRCFLLPAAAHRGYSGLELGNPTAAAKQRVYLKQGVLYRFHCAVTGPVHLAIESELVVFAHNNAKLLPILSSKWESLELDYLVRESGFYTVAVYRDDLGGLPGPTYVDTCTLYPSGSLPRYVGSRKLERPSAQKVWNPPSSLSRDGPQLLVNPGFEDLSPFGWKISGSYKIREDIFLEGNRGLELRDGAEARQQISSDARIMYRFRCYGTNAFPFVMEVSHANVLVDKNESGPERGGRQWVFKDIIFETKSKFFRLKVSPTGDRCYLDFCSLHLVAGISAIDSES